MGPQGARPGRDSVAPPLHVPRAAPAAPQRLDGVCAPPLISERGSRCLCGGDRGINAAAGAAAIRRQGLRRRAGRAKAHFSGRRSAEEVTAFGGIRRVRN
jgi:hypothetical protein